MALPDEFGAERRLRAERQNERLKLFVAFRNTLALAVIGASFVVPGVVSLAMVQ